MKRTLITALAALFVPAFAAAPAMADAAADFYAVADFYSGKTIKVIVGYGPGGGFDVYGRLLADHLPRHIRGKPSSFVQNMPGASSLKAAGYINNIAPKDGTVIGILNQAVPLNAFVWKKTGDGFDVAKFNWIGRLDYIDVVGVTWHTTGVKTIKDAIGKELAFAGTGATGTAFMIPTALNAAIGTKFRVVLGYKGTSQQYLAMEQGEMQGMGNAIWSQLMRTHKHWITENQVYPLYQASDERSKLLPGVPTIVELVKSDEDRKVMRLLASSSSMGRSFMAAPGIPRGRVVALRNAFDAMVADAAFRADAAKRKLALNPLSGVKLQKMIADLASYPESVFARSRALVGPDGKKKKRKKKKK